MKIQLPLRPSFLALALFACLALQAPLAQAQDVIKMRGPIKSVNAATKTLTLNHKKKGAVDLVWTDETKVRSEMTRNAAELKPGMFVLCFVEQDQKTIKTIRHQPENDQIAE